MPIYEDDHWGNKASNPWRRRPHNGWWRTIYGRRPKQGTAHPVTGNSLLSRYARAWQDRVGRLSQRGRIS